MGCTQSAINNDPSANNNSQKSKNNTKNNNGNNNNNKNGGADANGTAAGAAVVPKTNPYLSGRYLFFHLKIPYSMGLLARIYGNLKNFFLSIPSIFVFHSL